MAYWIFQSVSQKFDLPAALKKAPEHDNVLAFLVNQHADKIMPRDTVYLWFGGNKSPGLYAKATVQTRPAEIAYEGWQEDYAKVDFPPVALRVRLKIERLLEPPVARRDVIEISEMALSEFVRRNAQGTNFLLQPGEATAIERLLAEPRALGDPTPADIRSRSTQIAAPKSMHSKPKQLQNIHEAHLEDLIASDLEQIEPGLTLIGRQHDAGAAGRIDLLCRDAAGDIVVVELKRIGAKAAGVVEQTMAYVGWARKHLAGPGQQVRGIIVGGKPDAKLQYAVDGISNLTFRTLNVSIGDAG
jgi:hypothetical protein